MDYLIAAATSNSGKTTFTMGLLRALRDRGLMVQPFKCGPDYIDTMFHEMASGRESVNLDTFMSSENHVRELFNRYGHDADVRIVEGVMGLYDGYDGWHGSSAHIAAMLDIPVILVVNAKSVAYSVAPLIYGFKHFNAPGMNAELKIAGVVFNMVASENHFSFLRKACEDAGVRCLGYIAKNEKLVIPGRHLGLTIENKKTTEELISLAAEEVEKHVALSLFYDECDDSITQHEKKENYVTMPSETSLTSKKASSMLSNVWGMEGECDDKTERVIAVARDEAFNFTYRANIDALRKKGRVVFFSPLYDEKLPACDALYLPGGYPELFADKLSRNVLMRESIKQFAESGGHIFAECGGFMYLCEEIDETKMCGIFPFKATMDGARLHLGYRQNGHHRGHEFHYSSVVEPQKMPDEVIVEQCQKSAKGINVPVKIYHYKNVTAGYTHWYWAE